MEFVCRIKHRNWNYVDFYWNLCELLCKIIVPVRWFSSEIHSRLDLPYVVTILSFGFRKSKSIGSLITTIGVICAAMIGIGCLATHANNISVLDIVHSSFSGMFMGWIVISWIEHYLFPVDDINNTNPCDQLHQRCNCLRDDLPVLVSSSQRKDQPPSATVSIV